MQAFYLLLRYMSLDGHLSPKGEPSQASERDEIARAMKRLDQAQKEQLVDFVDRHLADGSDDQALARVFDDGHTYRVWQDAEGPRRLLNLIRDVAQDQR
jgi:hypothetical protein